LGGGFEIEGGPLSKLCTSPPPSSETLLRRWHCSVTFSRYAIVDNAVLEMPLPLTHGIDDINSAEEVSDVIWQKPAAEHGRFKRICVFSLLCMTVSALESLLRACESDLQLLDMSINVKKSSCVRIGHRRNVTCASITTCHGQPLRWVSEFRYLGVFIVSSRSFKCSLAYAKRSFYAAVNGLFGKLPNLASEEVILELV